MADEKKLLQCRNCDWTGTEDQLGRQLGEIHHLIEKIEPGEIVPYGECPECQCLCFAVSDLFPEKPTGIPEIDNLTPIQARVILAAIFREMYQEKDGTWNQDKEIPGADMVSLLCEQMPDLNPR